jgi:hypothetical protein
LLISGNGFLTAFIPTLLTAFIPAWAFAQGRPSTLTARDFTTLPRLAGRHEI